MNPLATTAGLTGAAYVARSVVAPRVALAEAEPWYRITLGAVLARARLGDVVSFRDLYDRQLARAIGAYGRSVIDRNYPANMTHGDLRDLVRSWTYGFGDAMESDEVAEHISFIGLGDIATAGRRLTERLAIHEGAINLGGPSLSSVGTQTIDTFKAISAMATALDLHRNSDTVGPPKHEAEGPIEGWLRLTGEGVGAVASKVGEWTGDALGAALGGIVDPVVKFALVAGAGYLLYRAVT